MNSPDTIAAVSTPAGEGGIGVVRVTGPGALAVGLRVFGAPALREAGPDGIEPRRLYYGRITSPGGETLDRGFFVFMKGPRSYTGEDTVELHTHGGALVVKKVLDALLSAGARLAGPGEFTRRAFLNGKLDLAQAEAVIDVIRAETDRALASAGGRLEGVFSRRVEETGEIVAGLLTRIEAELDFPEEEEVEVLPDGAISKEVDRAGARIKEMLATYEEGRVLREGIAAVILGRPNVGKSSLLNLLLKEERAIVTPTPGTTRDVIEEVVNIRGLPVRLMDTAGLRETTDHVESIGVEKARERAARADLVLFVVDSTDEDRSGDMKILGAAEGGGGRKTIIVANKIDLATPEALDTLRKSFPANKVVFISALDGSGAEGLKDTVYEEATGGAGTPGGPVGLVASARHRDALESALKGLGRVREAVAGGLGREFVATDLRWALDRLGEITGRTTTEDILDRIFSEFCIGK
ncbi:MAG: tRNA uridine-5-carboxymethylaminomethyl(34) synthesis GTPase MnmE [Thermodesulfobacteriota bacterium]